MNDKEFELRCISRELELEREMIREYDLDRNWPDDLDVLPTYLNCEGILL
tara:strand:+ start:476 stop:625 length:150 start_codon:yes stop_codon:yes gene_type:complete